MCAEHVQQLEGVSPFGKLMDVKSNEAPMCRREAGSEGSVEQNGNAGPMDKNQTRGILCRTREHGFAKSLSIKGAGCKSGSRALKAVELTSGDLSFVLAARLWME